MKSYDLYVNGGFARAESASTLDVVDPATGALLGREPDANAADVAKAVAAARAAFDSGPWKDTTAQDRGRVLFKLAEIVRARADELAELEQSRIGRELGKWGAEKYLKVKQVYINLSEQPIGWY